MAQLYAVWRHDHTSVHLSVIRVGMRLYKGALFSLAICDIMLESRHYPAIESLGSAACLRMVSGGC